MTRLLLVDDDREAIATLSEGLARIMPDTKMDMAESPGQAMEMLLQHSYDLVLSDFHMGAKTGAGLVKAMQSEDRLRHVPVIIRTEKPAEAAEALKEIGMQDTVPVISKTGTTYIVRGQINALLKQAAGKPAASAAVEDFSGLRAEGPSLPGSRVGS